MLRNRQYFFWKITKKLATYHFKTCSLRQPSYKQAFQRGTTPARIDKRIQQSNLFCNQIWFQYLIYQMWLQYLRRWHGKVQNIVAAFRGMHVSPAKHSFAWLPRKCDYRTDRHKHRRTDGRTDAGQSDPYVPLCFAGDTKAIRERELILYYAN